MAEVKLEKPLKLDDLKEGRIFDRIELIIDCDGKTMTTLTHQEGSELKNDHYQVHDMRRYSYDIKADANGNIISINNNGYGEVFLSDEEHDECKFRLIEAGVW